VKDPARRLVAEEGLVGCEVVDREQHQAMHLGREVVGRAQGLGRPGRLRWRLVFGGDGLGGAGVDARARVRRRGLPPPAEADAPEKLLDTLHSQTRAGLGAPLH